MQLCCSAQGNTNVIDLLNGGSGFYNMTIYSLGDASTLFILFLSVCPILFPLLAIGLYVPILITIMASKIFFFESEFLYCSMYKGVQRWSHSKHSMLR